MSFVLQPVHAHLRSEDSLDSCGDLVLFVVRGCRLVSWFAFEVMFLGQIELIYGFVRDAGGLAERPLAKLVNRYQQHLAAVGQLANPNLQPLHLPSLSTI